MEESKESKLERLRRQYSNLQKNFKKMVDYSSEEEINLLLDWINEVREAIKRLEKED